MSMHVGGVREIGRLLFRLRRHRRLARAYQVKSRHALLIGLTFGSEFLHLSIRGIGSGLRALGYECRGQRCQKPEAQGPGPNARADLQVVPTGNRLRTCT
jgi:hypothetical protein